MRLGPGLALCGFLSVAGPARAEPPGTSVPEPAPKEARRPRKSPPIALGVSLGVMGLGAGMLALGVAADSDAVATAGAAAAFVGPTVGRLYAGKLALGGLLVRTIGVGVIIHGAHERVTPDKCVPEEGIDCTRADKAAADRERRGNRIMYAGAALLVGATLWDIVWAPLDAREFNRAHALAIAPTLMPGGAGLALGGSF
jgi:hypothetical protein